MNFEMTADEIQQLLNSPNPQPLKEIRNRLLLSDDSDADKIQLLERLDRLLPESKH